MSFKRNEKKDKKQNMFLAFVIISSILIIILLIQQNHKLSVLQNWRKDIEIGQKAESVIGITLKGKNIIIPVKKIPTLLFFFNTTCKTCKKSIPYIVTNYNYFKEKGVKIIGICSEEINPAFKGIDYLKISFPIITDNKSKIFTKYRVHYVPMIVLIDKDERIVYVQPYGENIKQTMNNIRKILTEE